MRTILAMVAILLLALAGSGLAAPDAVSQIRTAMERDHGLPRDPAFYSHEVTISHSWDEPRTAPREPFISALSKELSIFDTVYTGRRWALTRFIVSGDTIIATARQTGTLPGGEQVRNDTAYFISLENGRIARIETWYDREQSAPIMRALSNAMGHR
jgi:hypothetical protein